jgi:hypothetical protein
MNLSRIIPVLARRSRRKRQAPRAMAEVEEKGKTILESGIWKVKRIM